MARFRWLAAGMLCAAPLVAQTPAADSARSVQIPCDSARTNAARRDSIACPGAQLLPAIVVSVGRTRDTLRTLPMAVGVISAAQLRGGLATLGLDESLAMIPGVYAMNRSNPSLDQRLSIRGFGSRANFGVRGVTILLDGIPQTLPDGQSQLTNVELGTIERIEVLRGGSSALYGNGSGGVVALESEPPDSTAPLVQRLRVQGGSFGASKWLARTSASGDRLGGVLTLSRSASDGFRQHSAADFRQLSALATWSATPRMSTTLRVALADNPRAENPGALTSAEYASRRDSAAANNILRRADKAVRQHQGALTLRHTDARGGVQSASVYGLTRELKNPLATGTYVDIDRTAGGIRLDASRSLGRGVPAPRLAAGLDLQRMRDARRNRRAIGGVPTDSIELDQIETVSQVAPSLQLKWTPVAALTVLGSARYDRIAFTVRDRNAGDGADQSGARRMSAWSAQGGASFAAGQRLIPYVSVSTAFETPTTTELANRPGDSGGFNDALGPQRAVTMEIGARGILADWMTYDGSVFRSRVRDAIVPFQEIGGRAYFQNAGSTRQDGVELGVTLRPASSFALTAAYTFAAYQFTEYRRQGGATTDTLDGRRLAGIPRHFARVVLRASPLALATVEVEQTVSSSLFADDRNTIRVRGWGAGVTNARVVWRGALAGLDLAPFVGLNNVGNRLYVGSVTINGVNGRVLEPAPGRNVYLGTELGWSTRKRE